MSDDPQVGQRVIWRFKGDREWSSHSHPWVVRALTGDDLVVLTSGFAEKVVTLSEIEWRPA